MENLCAVVVATTLAVGCGDDDGTRCAMPAECDVANVKCQQAVLDAIACERGQAAPALPMVRILASSEFAAEYRAETDPGANAGLWDAALSALHLLPAGTGVVEASVDVADVYTHAYYDPGDKRVTIRDDGLLDRSTAMFILSHELTHYLQDDAFDLTGMHQQAAATTDAQLALSALVEGDAMVTADRVAVRSQGGSVRSGWGDYYDTMESELVTAIDYSAAPLITAANRTPELGSRYVWHAWNGGRTAGGNWDGSRQRVDDLFGAPPRSLADILSGYHELAPATTQMEMLDCAPPDPPAGFRLAGIDQLGAAGALALLDVGGVADLGAGDLALAGSVRGDLIALYQMADADPNSPAEGVLVAWRLRFDRASLATGFLSRLAPLRFAAQAFDRELLITAATGPDNPLLAETGACPSPDEFVTAARAASVLPTAFP